MDVLRDIPVVTRTYLIGSFLTTAACALDLVSPYALYLNYNLIFTKFEIWRLVTCFFFFDSRFSLDFLFRLFFLVRYCKSLEEGSFRGRTIDFLYMILLGATLLLIISPLTHFSFLGPPLTFMMVYLWARRNPFSRMSFLGIFTFTAPFMPWILLVFSVLLGGDGYIDIAGIAIGHLYYYLEDVYPRLTPYRTRLLKTPRIIEILFAPAIGEAQQEFAAPPDIARAG